MRNNGYSVLASDLAIDLTYCLSAVRGINLVWTITSSSSVQSAKEHGGFKIYGKS